MQKIGRPSMLGLPRTTSAVCQESFSLHQKSMEAVAAAAAGEGDVWLR